MKAWKTDEAGNPRAMSEVSTMPTTALLASTVGVVASNDYAHISVVVYDVPQQLALAAHTSVSRAMVCCM